MTKPATTSNAELVLGVEVSPLSFHCEGQMQGVIRTPVGCDRWPLANDRLLASDVNTIIRCGVDSGSDQHVPVTVAASQKLILSVPMRDGS